MTIRGYNRHNQLTFTAHLQPEPKEDEVFIYHPATPPTRASGHILGDLRQPREGLDEENIFDVRLPFYLPGFGSLTLPR